MQERWEEQMPVIAPRIRDAGVTLVELVITVALMGTVVLGVLTATRTSIRASRTAFEGSQIETLLLNATDNVNRARQICDYDEYVLAAAVTQGWVPSGTPFGSQNVVDSTTTKLVAGAWVPCTGDPGAFDVIKVEISARTPSGDMTRLMTVVKSNVQDL